MKKEIIKMPEILKDKKGDPLKIPFDTNMLPPLEFIIEATKRSKPLAIIYLIITLSLSSIAYFLMPLIALYILIGAVVIYYFLLDKYATRRQLVIRTGEHGENYLDEQKWYKEIANQFPDGAKHLHKNQRIGVWHIRENTIREFNPWIAPYDSESVEGSEVGNINSLMEGASQITKYREMTANEKLQMGMFAVIIVGSLLGMIMGIGQLTNTREEIIDDPGDIGIPGAKATAIPDDPTGSN